eukprot:COSAG05_NODE_14039_length_410_cov_0.839228_1_plen_44_part_01
MFCIEISFVFKSLNRKSAWKQDLPTAQIKAGVFSQRIISSYGPD